jgi:hypothetical protein
VKFRKRGGQAAEEAPPVVDERPLVPEPPVGGRGSVAKVSHTLNNSLAERLREFAFFQRVSESAVIEFSLQQFFDAGDDDEALGERLRRNGAGRRRRA